MPEKVETPFGTMDKADDVLSTNSVTKEKDLNESTNKVAHFLEVNNKVTNVKSS